MTVTVPAPGVVRFLPDRRDALRVTIRDTAGVLARAGLQTGDHVVAIEGRTFATEEEVWRLLNAAGALARATLTVERGTDAFPVVLAGDDLAVADRWGGELDPVAR
jgi:S1-C subfamily serine protease